MKVVVGHNSSIVRWVARLVGGAPRRARESAGALQSLDADQLRQVSGGNGTTQAPNKGW
jgi:phosphohistidine phosphatase SixA